jgi:predicted RecA/RadA family phage recombinase
MLGIALDSANVDDGIQVLIKGFVSSPQANNTSSAMGTPLYIDASAFGKVSETAPSGSGEVVRLVGYTFWNTANQTNGLYIIRFDPDNSFVVI